MIRQDTPGPAISPDMKGPMLSTLTHPSAPTGPDVAAQRAAMDAAEANTAAVNTDSDATSWDRMAAAEQEMQAGSGYWVNEYEPEAS